MLRRLGGYVSDECDAPRGNPDYDHQFPIFGLDAAGKSTLLYRLFYSQHILTFPDHSFRPGQVGIIPLWHVYVEEIQAKAVIFVVDSTDWQRLLYTKDALWQLFGHYDDTEAGRELILKGWLHERLEDKEDEDGISEGLMLPRVKGLLRVCSGWMFNSEEGVRSHE
ncbi:hypothetical protein BGZ91_007000 [Linnemannia elongata]|nr:hypothetical protein BGZ91_007000 [Linnemannia elongata]KAG0050159.1 hypothetical protein BGZ90_007123 [Linnemannia elongata]